MMVSKNRLFNCSNPYQGKAKKVLCICSAGLLRSPTMAVVLSQEPYNFNTRAAGLVEDYALIPVDEVLCTWADLIITAHPDLFDRFTHEYPQFADKATTLLLPDMFEYMDLKLVEEIRKGMEYIDHE